MARERRTRLERGTVFGVWRLESFVGRGGQAEVWTVRHTSEKHVPQRAIKVCMAAARKARQRFENEAKLLHECKHENIVPILDVDLTWATRGALPASSYYVMELAEGPLDKHADKSSNVIRTLELFRQACRAIMFLHERNSPVLHRDIKPSNLLVAAEGGRLMVTDFGIATEVERQGELTASKEVVGSQVYRAPEVSQGQSASVRSDVFSLGKVFERVLTHSIPDQAQPWPIPDSVWLSEKARQQLERVIAKATAWNPNERYGSVRQLLDAIPALRVDVDGAAEKEPPGSEATLSSEWEWKEDQRVNRHRAYFEANYSFWSGDAIWSMYATTRTRKKLQRAKLDDTFLNLGARYSEAFNYTTRITTHAKGFTREFPSQRRDQGDVPIETWSAYEDGLLTYDTSLNQHTRYNDEIWLNLNAATYEILRFLQLANELFDESDPILDIVIDLRNPANVVVPLFYYGNHSGSRAYGGYHEPIVDSIARSEISTREQWNKICPPVRQLLEKISSIFGFSDIPQVYWDADGQLGYSKSSPSRQ